MRGKKRPTTERAQAVGIALVTGNVQEAADQTGIPRRTVAQWVQSNEFAELRQRTKEVVAEEWWGFIQQAFQRTAELLAQTEDPVKSATAGAIMFDKRAMALGEATSRYEHREFGALDDHELATLKAILQGGHPAEHPAEVAVVDSGQNGTAPA